MNKSVKARKDAVQIIGKGIDYDQRLDMLIFIAADFPSVFMKAAQKANVIKNPDEWKEHSKELIRAGQFVEAIKWCRSCTGWGLKEAKDACDLLKSLA